MRPPRLSGSVRLHRRSEKLEMNRPQLKWLPLVAWVWILVGVGKILCSLWVLSSGSNWDDALTSAASLMGPDAPWLWRFFFFVSRHLLALGLLDMSTGVLVVATAMCLLRRHAWARVGIETICWCAVAVTVGSLVYWEALLRTAADVQNPSASDFAAFVMRQTYFGGIRLVVLAASIWFLMRKSTRAAFVAGTLRADEA